MWNRRKVTTYVSLLTIFFKIMTDEAINVLFIGMLCLRTLEVHTFEAVEARILSLGITLNFYIQMLYI